MARGEYKSPTLWEVAALLCESHRAARIVGRFERGLRGVSEKRARLALEARGRGFAAEWGALVALSFEWLAFINELPRPSNPSQWRWVSDAMRARADAEPFALVREQCYWAMRDAWKRKGPAAGARAVSLASRSSGAVRDALALWLERLCA